ncbi:OLC1v1036949C1 [Oldenlandia corymbosa var. corymbosa]|uniref:OLC1v1036949C1 n=1 Tax=Oldenlandia corymbosa var. corymbosa TaxID=529605 RepID=A0AAV1CWG1_OLDCO|nr:OLC1v1036949C1 [Oldenlandia corymbosa var. corymbosa]
MTRKALMSSMNSLLRGIFWQKVRYNAHIELSIMRPMKSMALKQVDYLKRKK